MCNGNKHFHSFCAALLCSTRCLWVDGPEKSRSLALSQKGEQAWCSLLLPGCADLLDHSPFLYKCTTAMGDSPQLPRKPSSVGGHSNHITVIWQGDPHYLPSGTCGWEQMKGKLNFWYFNLKRNQSLWSSYR